MDIIHLSDTHFGTEVPAIVEALAETIHTIDPAIIILSGDVTQRARPSQFKAATDFLARFPARSFVIPGNHDIALYNLFSRFVVPYANFKQAFNTREFIVHRQDVTIVGFDATHPKRHTRGWLSPKHVEATLTRAREAAPGNRLWVSVHQPLVTAYVKDAHEALINHNEIAALFSRHKVDLVMSGHVHVPQCTLSKEHFKVERSFLLCNAGTAISARTRVNVPNSFTRLTTTPERLTVTFYYYDADKGFRPDAAQPFIYTDEGVLPAPTH